MHGLVLILTLVWSALVGSMALIMPSLCLLVLPFDGSRMLYRQWSAYVAKVKIVLSGDDLPYAEPAMIVCNHRTRIDWMFMWCLCLRLGLLNCMKIVLKDSLKSIPGFGWAMQSFLFVFLARDKSIDLKHMGEMLGYHTNNKLPLSLILFPEGTDLSPHNMAKSDAFASQNGLTKYRHVLHPKVIGWARSISLLRATCPAVYDVTIAYHDYEEVFKLDREGVKWRHPMSLMPESPAEVEEWIKQSFARKEKRLHQFYGNSKTFGPPSKPPIDEVEIENLWRQSLMFWSLASVLVLVSFFLVFGGLLFQAFSAIVWVLLTKAGGVDIIELWLHGERGLYRRLIETQDKFD
ncbi:hypothetical protein GUITHDRAFT_116847 [Guillardia theta CCMP2712]|uniref:Phospholipid/glycerol acyltransferase domain-containing protein n=1 Tax=Guillardia theta (strain CCMP2712) TaxID=905079 RepID=L1IMF4_GUITC|nr:hypothetical protein GUITHDRAFT_116847 [Guillardia theta CCMP2712]EKX36980.1 hypothetical protein GUITHDRAFT_116847 [Guillardia theta CCMP2712]|eukprot:XP_005823960.1 hypothetical protein GUITHDRAFT_116847 [Guillardia theta CCMP2712]